MRTYLYTSFGNIGWYNELIWYTYNYYNQDIQQAYHEIDLYIIVISLNKLF